MPTEMLMEDGREATVAPMPQRVGEAARRELDVRGRTITTAIAWAVHEQFAELEIGDEIELETEPFPAIVPDLEAWCRTCTSSSTCAGTPTAGGSGSARGSHAATSTALALVVSTDELTELLSPLGFALAAALGGAQVSVYLLGPAVHLLAPGFRARLRGPARPFSRFARADLEKAGHVAPTEKLRQLQALGGTLYACGPSLQHFRVDPERLALDDVVVCEYLTFMDVMQRSDVQLYT